jgi:methionyl-tRNA synthetase
LIGRLNSELADGLGNLVSRTLAMIDRFTQGKIPPNYPPHDELDGRLEQAISELTESAMVYLKDLRFNRALESMWELIQRCDQYIDKTAPWTLAKRAEGKSQLHGVLYRVVNALERLIPVLYPFMPQTAENIAAQLGLHPQIQGRKLLARPLAPGFDIAKGKPLFPKIDIAHMQGVSTMTNRQPSTAESAIGSTPPTSSGSPPAQITIEEFQRIQLKTAKVLSAERVPRSEKLIKLLVDLGGERRQIVAGIGKKYEPEALVGRCVVIVANLKPAKLMGIESQGMVLAAGDAEVGGLVTVLEEVAPGTKVK